MNRFVAVIAREIREAIPAFLFFLVVFQLGQITRALTLEEYHITLGRTAVAVIVAKAILVADALPLTKVFANRALAYSIVWTSLVYFVITSAFHYIEELIPLWRTYGGVVAAHERLLAEVH